MPDLIVRGVAPPRTLSSPPNPADHTGRRATTNGQGANDEPLDSVYSDSPDSALEFPNVGCVWRTFNKLAIGTLLNIHPPYNPSRPSSD